MQLLYFLENPVLPSQFFLDQQDSYCCYCWKWPDVKDNFYIKMLPKWVSVHDQFSVELIWWIQEIEVRKQLEWNEHYNRVKVLVTLRF